VLASYTMRVNSARPAEVEFTYPKAGKAVLNAWRYMNNELSNPGVEKSAVMLKAMYVEAIRPLYDTGTGGSYRKVKIK
jgi:hypothetical protein